MKKITLFALSIVMVACAPKSATKYGQITKVTDYLYEITFDQVDENVFNEIQEVDNQAACSSVRNGNFHGRNLDLYYNEGCEVVVHVKAGKNNFASVAVCGATPTFTAEVAENCPEEVMRRMPFCSLDGINENGVAVNINVVPAIDMPIATGTNPNGKRMHMSMCPRYILNYAKSAAHAVELLKELNLFGGFGEEFGLHLMISDIKETYIVEVINNQLQYYRGEPYCNSNIMTNLYSTLLPELTDHADGVERYHILQTNYDEGATEEGMSHLMQRVRYSFAYEETTTPFWLTEFGGTLVNEDGTTTDINIHSTPEEIMKVAEPIMAKYRQHERKGEFWQTVNTSIYDIENKTLLLYVQEDYEHPYRFGI